MNREEYAQTMLSEVLKLQKMDNEYVLDGKLDKYPEGKIRLVVDNLYNVQIAPGDNLFIAVDLYNDTEEELTTAYNKLMDYADRRYEAIFGKGE